MKSPTRALVLKVLERREAVARAEMTMAREVADRSAAAVTTWQARIEAERRAVEALAGSPLTAFCTDAWREAAGAKLAQAEAIRLSADGMVVRAQNGLAQAARQQIGMETYLARLDADAARAAARRDPLLSLMCLPRDPQGR